ncbi:MAG: LptF/LptG family permease [Muribaculaceae bacterium]
MVIVKRLYTFMLQRFLPLLLMTFVICLFIVMMQFLWRYIEDLVGKGLSIKVIAELFFYAAITMVPTALPLAVLLASLMTFGNLGERFELTAMKAAGISLLRIMKPLIVFMVLLSIGCFFFQNNILPIAQTKMYTVLFSVRQKSPEVEIPVRSFYDQIPGMNIYVERKNPDSGMLYDLIIYDMSRGLDNTRVILADSGKLNFTEDKTRLFLHLYRGEMFENLRESSMGASSSSYLPFRRESFSDKQIYFLFDANFNRMDEGTIRSQYVGKNVLELNRSIDSIAGVVDSLGTAFGIEQKEKPYLGLNRYRIEYTDGVGKTKTPVALPEVDADLNIDSLFAGPTPALAKTYVVQAINKANIRMREFDFRASIILEQEKLMRRHQIELQKRFTLSFAILIFFFIGAPLGAIIKKGGIGTPLVISVLLFIVYFIFDNMGYKMARDDRAPVWLGIWLSSIVLLPLGIFLTYKAIGDSNVLNIDAYRAFFRRLAGKGDKRTLEIKEVIMDEVDIPVAIELTDRLDRALIQAQERLKRKWKLTRLLRTQDLDEVNDLMSNLIEYLSNSRSMHIIDCINRYPFRVNSRNILNVIDTTRRLASMLSAEVEPNQINASTEHESENNS